MVMRGLLTLFAAFVVLASGDFLGAHALGDQDGAGNMKIVDGGDVHFDGEVAGARGLGSSSGGGGGKDSSDSKSGSSSSDSKSGSSSSDSKSGSSSSDSKSGSSSSDSKSGSSSSGKGHKRSRYLRE